MCIHECAVQTCIHIYTFSDQPAYIHAYINIYNVHMQDDPKIFNLFLGMGFYTLDLYSVIVSNFMQVVYN